MRRRSNHPLHFLLFLTALLPSLSLPQHACCQASSDPTNDGSSLFARELDSLYIRDYKDIVTTRVFTLFQDATLKFFDNNGNEFKFKPYVPVRFGIAGFYKWFGLGLSAGFPFTRNNYERFVETDLLDFRILAYSKIGTFEFYYQQYSGLYLAELNQAANGFYGYPDMKVYSGGLIATYAYNYARYSMRAAFIQNERQLKSAGSLLIRPSILFYRIDSDSITIPLPVRDAYAMGSGQLHIHNNTWTFSLAPGYAYSLVFLKHFYVNASLFFAVNYQIGTTDHPGNKSERISNIIFSSQGRFSAGYNSDVWYLGASYILNIDEFPLPSNKVQSCYNLTQLRIWAGTRFDLFRKAKSKK